MKKKLITAWLITSIGFTPIAYSLVSISSCSKNNENIDAIELYPETDNIRPGETKIIRAVGLPNYKRITNLNWTLIDCPYPEISINSIGHISADVSLSVTEPIVITIQATLPSNEAVTSTTQMTVLPDPLEDFQGFKNNEIQFINYEQQVDSVQLNKIDDKTYVTSHNVDVFEGMMSDWPEGWTSWINFTPLVGGDAPIFMSFTLDGGDYSHHTIQWREYNDSSWTSMIPAFDTVSNVYIWDKIIVRFSCDPAVRLIVNLTAWQKPEQDTQGMYAFIPDSGEEEENPLSFLSEGIYKLKIPCPGMAKQGIITKSINSLYAFRPKFFYSDFYFEWQEQPDLDPDIKNMFVYFQTTEPLLIERPFDALRAYKISMSYKIDLSLRQYTYEHWDYNDVFMGTIFAMDPTTGDAINLEVWLTWQN